MYSKLTDLSILFDPWSSFLSVDFQISYCYTCFEVDFVMNVVDFGHVICVQYRLSCAALFKGMAFLYFFPDFVSGNDDGLYALVGNICALMIQSTFSGIRVPTMLEMSKGLSSSYSLPFWF